MSTENQAFFSLDTTAKISIIEPVNSLLPGRKKKYYPEAWKAHSNTKADSRLPVATVGNLRFQKETVADRIE